MGFYPMGVCQGGVFCLIGFCLMGFSGWGFVLDSCKSEFYVLAIKQNKSEGNMCFPMLTP